LLRTGFVLPFRWTFADVIKTRVYYKSIDLGLPEKMVANLFCSTQAPDQRRTLFMQLVGSSLIVFLGTLMRFVGEAIKLAESVFIDH
jgi:hypothetical protein